MAEPQDLEPKLRALLAERQRDLVWYHRLGQILRRRQEAWNYGEGQMERLAERLGKPQWRDLLFRARQLAKVYTEAEVRELVAEVSWSRMKVLLTVTKAKAKKLQKRAMRHRWSVQRLRFEAAQARRRRPLPPAPQRKAAQAPEEYQLWRVAKRIRTCRALLQKVWPNDRQAKVRPGGTKLSRLARYAADTLQSLAEAIERRRQPVSPS
jgi:hypothetical protein